jgi:formylglycine-generating enzyme required for sulfatase activity
MMSNRSGPLATKWWVLLVAVAAGVVACAKDDGAAAPRAPADAMPASVAVSGSEVELGVHLGKSRESTAVSAFSISRLPTTVHQYRQCVQAGVCSAPSAELAPCGERERGVDGATFQTVDGADRLPVTCTTPSQAARYCAWVGGRLPRADEWLLAARGPKVARFPWGNDPASCERHWRTTFWDDGRCCGTACSPWVAAELDQHAKGASPSGVANVLVTAGELTLPPSKLALLGCAPGARACLVSGLAPGAIDFISAELDSVSSFRCVWEE